jgi:hypothetical protein
MQHLVSDSVVIQHLVSDSVVIQHLESDSVVIHHLVSDSVVIQHLVSDRLLSLKENLHNMTKWGGNQVLNKMNVDLFMNTLLITSE